MIRLILHMLAMCILSTACSSAMAQASSSTFPTSGDVGNLGWITPDSSAARVHSKGAERPFPVRTQFQIGLGTLKDVRAQFGSTVTESDRLYDLGAMLDGARSIPIAKGVDGEYGGVFGINLDVLRLGFKQAGSSFSFSSETTTGLRLTLSVAPQIAARLKAGERGYLRAFLSLGPMATYEHDIGRRSFFGREDGGFDWGSSLRIGVEAGAIGFPVTMTLGHQRFGYKPDWSPGSPHDGLTFIAISPVLHH